jgi:hypothetical protein
MAPISLIMNQGNPFAVVCIADRRNPETQDRFTMSQPRPAYDRK